MIEAKPVSNKFWILRDSDKKIGEVNADNNGYIININGKYKRFPSLNLLKEKTGIKFSDIAFEKPTEDDNTLYGYPFVGEKFNEIWDIKLQLPLYTKKSDSKSQFVAGHFKVKIKGKWRDILAPKLLILQRNEFHGPFKTAPHDNVLNSPTSPPTSPSECESHLLTNNTTPTTFPKNSPLSKWFS